MLGASQQLLKELLALQAAERQAIFNKSAAGKAARKAADRSNREKERNDAAGKITVHDWLH